MMQVEIALPAAAQVHATLAGRKSELASLLANNDAESWRIPVTRATLHHIEGLYLLASEHGKTVVLVPSGPLDERERAFLDDFLAHRIRSNESQGRLAHRYSELWAFISEVAQAALRSASLGSSLPSLDGKRFEEVVIIGAYGGDHVGDAAILGGVLLHLHQAYGTRRAHVMSHRADHTRRLAAGLETPVAVEVHDYQPRIVDSLFAKAEALVLAGGPLMDLPRVLAKHLAAIGTARAQGRPFLIERVGVGPFKRPISRWAAKRIARAASRISVRTSASAADPALAGLEVEAGRDPAFDYLATRSTLSRLTPAEAESVSALLAGTQGRLLVGVNIRPIRHLWSRRGAEYSKAMEDRFYDRLAAALTSFAQNAGRPVTYVFFPMNPIQFGASDLAAAYRLHRLIGGAADFRVWEADPDVDGVLHLLRHLDVAIAMRFHACIFALSQDLPVLGIDYYPGQGGKVEEMFGDMGRSVDVRRIDTMEAEWLTGRLEHYAAAIAAPGMAQKTSP